MKNFLYKMGNAVARFMYGRNGTDQLNMAILAAYAALWVLGSLLSIFVDSRIFNTVYNLLMTMLAVALFWRTFSKNLAKRREENARFLKWWYPVKNRFAGARARHQDKDHKYFTCKNCKAICRVPAGKGSIVITCPKCGNKITGKS